MSKRRRLQNLGKQAGVAVGLLLLVLFVVPGLSADGVRQQLVQPQALIITVTNTADSGPGSLRNAILTANASAGMDVVNFNIPGTGVHQINLASQLPDITDTIIIDGLTQPGASNASWPPVLKIELDGSQFQGAAGLNILASNCIIRGLVINRFTSGIVLTGTFNQIKCNFIGTDASGTVAQGNTIRGIGVSGNSNQVITIGGTEPGDRNLISGNLIGVQLFSETSANLVQGNYIGTNAQGTAAVPNGDGIIISNSSSNIIGGVAAGARNLISGNTNAGVIIRDTPANGEATGNVVAGNYIGTDATGTLGLGNGEQGVNLKGGANNNTIGGTTAAARNIISGNNFGVSIDTGATHNFVQGNYIGTNYSGTAALGNVYYGVIIENGPQNTIGGTAPGAGNVISATQTFAGVALFLEESTGNLVQGNYIGTDASGSVALGNVWGIYIATGASNNAIGGAAAGARNVISGNSADGITIYSSSEINTTNNRVEGNFIGTDATGNAALGNGTWGVRISQSASGNFIGGLPAGTGNKIAYNGLAGVAIFLPTATTGNWVARNSIFANGGLGIDFITSPDNSGGVTSNDAGDFDAGPNNLQNYPLITSVTAAGVASGSLNSTANTVFRIEFFANDAADASGNGEGEIYLGHQNVTTNVFGNASFNFTFTPVAGKPFISATATNTLTGDTSEFSSSAAPTAVTLAAFEANAYDGGVLIKWQTGFEADNLGFRIYREVDGQRQLVNQEIIAGSALSTGTATVLAAGQHYHWWDAHPSDSKGAQYWLEDLDLNGQSTWHGPFYARRLGGTPPPHSAAELLSQRGRVQSGITLPATQTTEAMDDHTRTESNQTMLVTTEGNLASQPAVKIATRGEGWYRVGQPALLAAGLDATVNPNHLQMYVGGVERPCIINGEEDGKFDEGDTLEFYAEGLESASTDLQVHWLVAGKQAGLRVAKVESDAGTIQMENYPYSVRRRDRTIYFSALRNGERENFFGPVITASPVDQSLTLTQVEVGASEPAQLEVTLQGVTMVPHRVNISFNGTALGEVVFANQERGTLSIPLSQSLIREGANEIYLTALGGAGDASLVDEVRLTYRRKFVAEDNQLAFTASGKQSVIITGFTSDEIRVADVTNPAEVKEVRAKVEQQGEGYAAMIKVSEGGERHLLAIAVEQARFPVSVTQNVPSKWRQKSNGADLILITRSELAAALAPLKMLRQSQGLAVETINIEDLYDEFNDGQKSPQAIKDFLAYARRHWKRKPGYVLLGADASLDPKNYLGLGDFDLVPTKLLDTELMETASDDWLADFDDDGLAELAVGRLPFRSLAEANRMMAKLISYEKSPRRDSLLLVADKNDGYDFAAALSGLKPLVPQAIKVQEVGRNDGEPFEVRQKLMEAISDGQKIVNYAGHGSVNLWRGGLLSSEEALGMTNSTLPVFVMMTCLNGYFQDPGVNSLAESLIKAEGGAIAVWASSGMTLPEPQRQMNEAFYRQLFGQGGENRLGEMVRRSKAAINDSDVRKSWVLIGDPTLKIR